MTDTLRSIVEGMKCDYSYESLRYDSTGFWEHDRTKCPKCRLEALLAEYEKVDLVKRWHESGRGLTSEVQQKCADELETWLAVNLERIKQEAKREFLRKLYRHGVVGAGTFGQWNHALEAQAKEKP